MCNWYEIERSVESNFRLHYYANVNENYAHAYEPVSSKASLFLLR